MAGRPRLAQRRKALGFSQESLAEQLGADRCTVGRWERGECEPQPFQRSRLARLLQVTPEELATLLIAEDWDGGHQSAPAQALPAGAGTSDLDEMNRRDLLRLLSVAGAVMTSPDVDTPSSDALADPVSLDAYHLVNTHLWQIFAMTDAKQQLYPLARQHLTALIDELGKTHTLSAYTRLCALTSELLQLCGEILFDGNKYTDAALCYTLAADASTQAGSYDLLACALTRHAFLALYERQFADADAILTAATRAAKRGDPQLSTRHWVAAVHAETHAGLGDADACYRALDLAGEVQAMNGPVCPGGWLRFDGSRLAEERGTCYRELGRTDLAEATLNQALGATVSRRRRGSIYADLALLGVQRYDSDHILYYGHQALALAEHTQSSGYLGRRLRTLREQLRPLLSDPRVAAFSEQLPLL